MKQLFNNINNKKKAFTLIELLIVIAIIGILSGAVIVAMSGTQESAIDSRIKASMAQLRSSIEIYGLVNGANYTGLESDSEISLLIDDIESQVGTPTVNISGSGDRYCLSTNLKSSNELWCIDSAGFAGLGGCINYSCDTSLGYSSGGIPISTGLVGYWTMDEDSLLSSNTIRDYSPYGNTGTIYGATFTTDRKGKANSAMSFDGVNDYVTVASNGLNKFSYQSFTISAWVKPEIIQNYTLIWSYDYTSHVSPYYSQHLRINSAREIYFYWNNGTLMQKIATPAIISKDVWHHIVVTYTSGSQKIYVNSKEEAVGIATGVISYYNQPVWIGKSNFGITKGALIDDVRIYNRALSETEIKTLYNSYNPNIKMKTSLPKIKLYGGD